MTTTALPTLGAACAGLLMIVSGLGTKRLAWRRDLRHKRLWARGHHRLPRRLR